jgi:DNA-binding NtrC family response regulator
MDLDATIDQTWDQERARPQKGTPIPGLLLVWSGKRPTLAAIPLPRPPAKLDVGRGRVGPVLIEDATVSRKHARIGLEAGVWRIEDLDSRNGTAVDAVPLVGEYSGPAPRLVRVGDSLLLPRADVRPFIGAVLDLADNMVKGPTLAAVWQEVAAAAQSGESLHITGESGSGKELAARAFHSHGHHADGPFIAVNCANIPTGVAERLLFGAKKGAYSGSTADADGYLQAAHGGTLFLDEVAELDLSVQAKLLRVLETKEVLALGAAKGRPIDVRVVSATHKPLRGEVAAGRFRDDLYFRIGRPEVSLPPLRERAEELPWLIERELKRAEPHGAPHVSLVEQCIMRRWPGNIRELMVELRAAARNAAEDKSAAVEARHLSAQAGSGFVAAPGSSSDEATAESPMAPDPDHETIVQALRAARGNVSAAARALGMHRTQLRRWLAKNPVDGA